MIGIVVVSVVVCVIFVVSSSVVVIVCAIFVAGLPYSAACLFFQLWSLLSFCCVCVCLIVCCSLF